MSHQDRRPTPYNPLSIEQLAHRRKLVAEPRGSNVLAPDLDLSAPLSIGLWELSGQLSFSCPSNAPDAQFGWQFTGGAVNASSWSHDGLATTTTSGVQQSDHNTRLWPTVAQIGVIAGPTATRLCGLLVVTAPTVVRVIWAQINNTPASPVTLQANSFITFRRVG